MAKNINLAAKELLDKFTKGCTILCFTYKDEVESANYYEDIKAFMDKLAKKFKRSIAFYGKRNVTRVIAILDMDVSNISYYEITDFWDKGTCKVEKTYNDKIRKRTKDNIIKYISNWS